MKTFFSFLFFTREHILNSYCMKEETDMTDCLELAVMVDFCFLFHHEYSNVAHAAYHAALSSMVAITNLRELWAGGCIRV